MSDEMDQPQEDAYELAVPFVVCKTQGGPFDDDAFVAGFQAGTIDQALRSGPAGFAMKIWFPMVRTALVPQLELLAMNRGYPVVKAESTDEYPDWCDVTFYASEHDGELS